MKRFIFAAILAISALNVQAQYGPIRGESSVGVYENIKTDGLQALSVNIANYSQATWVQGASTIGTSSGTLLATSTTRKRFIIQNTHATQNLFINFGGAAATTSHMRIGPGVIFISPDNAPIGAITGISDGAGTTFIAISIN